MIPSKWDFRNIGGYDFTGPVRDQLACGSCYSLGFIQTIEARLKLKFGQIGDIPKLSTQFLMQCNFLNEGCEGGWGIFHGFFAEQGHMVTEECAPYKAKTKGSSCANYKHCPAVAKVKKSYYVNDYNFKPTVQMIQKEMLRNGPVVAEFKCDDNFSLYSSGVMIQPDRAPNTVPEPLASRMAHTSPSLMQAKQPNHSLAENRQMEAMYAKMAD